MPAILATWWTAPGASSRKSDIETITGAYHRWRAKPASGPDSGLGEYQDIPGFCKSATLEEVRKHGFVLTPGRYVGAEDAEDDGVSFEERFSGLRAKLGEQFAEGQNLSAAIELALDGVVESE